MRANEHEESSPPRETREGGLAELIELERRVEAELAAARRAAEERIESARREGLRLLEGSDGDLEAALEALRVELERDGEAELRALELEAAREAARFDAAPETTLERLGRLVAARLAGRDDP